MRERAKALFTNRNFYLSIGSILIAFILFLLLLDNFIMPAYTNYDEGITVPNITRISLDEAKHTLESSGLRYEIAERRSNAAFPADYVIDQNPTPSEIVKPDRKVYLTVNIVSHPTATVPKVTDLSFRNAKIQLENAGLEVGTISYESSRFKNTVLRQSIEPSKVVEKGIQVDLAVSDGLGEKIVQIPDIIGLRLAEAQKKLREAGLRVGEFRFRPSKQVAPNVVLDYSPKQNSVIEGKSIKLVISERFDAKEQDESGAVIDTSFVPRTDSTRNNN